MIKTLRYCILVCLSALGAVASDLGAEGESYVDADYERFMRGVLVYQPTPGSDVGQVEIPISSLDDPLQGTFDLSDFGDTGHYISIHTGYKKDIIPANTGKVEIWVCPRFLVERDLETTARRFAPIMAAFESPIAYFWTWASIEAGSVYDYSLPTKICMNNELSLYEKWQIRGSSFLRNTRAQKLHASKFFFFKF